MLGSVTPSGTGVSIRFTHAPRYSQGLQARVRVWNPIGPDGKPLAANKEVEETLPTPTNANAGVITPNGGALTLPVRICACMPLPVWVIVLWPLHCILLACHPPGTTLLRVMVTNASMLAAERRPQ